MNRRILGLAVVFAALVTAACGGTVMPEETGLSTQKQGLLDNGEGCSADAECGSGLCWHTEDSYPLYNPSWEQGSVCTVECEPGSTGDTYCQQLAAQLGASTTDASAARCIFARAVYDNGQDGEYYVCDLIASGFGWYWSE